MITITKDDVNIVLLKLKSTDLFDAKYIDPYIYKFDLMRFSYYTNESLNLRGTTIYAQFYNGGCSLVKGGLYSAFYKVSLEVAFNDLSPELKMSAIYHMDILNGLIR